MTANTMRTAQEVINVIDSVKELREARDIARAHESKLDKASSTLFHLIELGNLDAVGMIKVTKALRKTLQRRRAIKHHKIQLDNALDRVDGSEQALTKVITRAEDNAASFDIICAENLAEFHCRYEAGYYD